MDTLKQIDGNRMHEQRKYFRVKNTGQIKAHCGTLILKIIEVSSAGAIIEMSPDLPTSGLINLQINNFTTTIQYTILRTEHEIIVLEFTNDHDKDNLFSALKHFRDEQK
jgi:hypothetical protein